MIPVLYGSQTGTCAHLARLLSQEIDVGTFILPIDKFDFACANDFQLIVFIVATHGDGNCPFNMAKLCDILSLNEPVRIFTFKYAVLCVGSSGFERYNWCGKILYERLHNFGGTGVLRTLADTKAEEGVYGGFRVFTQKLKEIVSTLVFPLQQKSKEECTLRVSQYDGRVVERKLVTDENYDQKVYEVVFEIQGYQEYLPGDCIGVMPENPSQYLSALEYESNEERSMIAMLDLMAPPRQTFFQHLESYCTSDVFRKKIREIQNDYNLYFEYVVKPRRSPLEVLSDFDIRPLAKILLSLEPIYKRYYSVAKIGNYYKILLRDVEYMTTMKLPRKGLCCEYLKSLTCGESIKVEVATSRLFFEDKNLLFFATGTGITLPRSIVHFCEIPKNIRIYQGFRRYNKDQLCHEEFKDCTLFSAASVDEKQYVMDVYRKNPVPDIENWLVFVSGNTRVNKEIRKLLKEVHGKDVPFQSETW